MNSKQNKILIVDDDPVNQAYCKEILETTEAECRCAPNGKEAIKFLKQEHFDLAMRRRHYFDPAMQRLLSFAGSERFVQRAEALGGYDIAELGHVVYNA